MRWYEDPEYQLMCEKAKKMQEKWKRKDGDYFYHPAQKVLIQSAMDYHINIPAGVSVIHSGKGFYGNCNYRIDEIAEIMWRLPSQEDLQEMLKPKIRENQKNTYAFVKGRNPEAFINSCLLADFHRWENNLSPYPSSILTITGLLLAFVLYELHQKKWNPEKKEWEEIK